MKFYLTIIAIIIAVACSAPSAADDHVKLQAAAEHLLADQDILHTHQWAIRLITTGNPLPNHVDFAITAAGALNSGYIALDQTDLSLRSLSLPDEAIDKTSFVTLPATELLKTVRRFFDQHYPQLFLKNNIVTITYELN